MSGTKFTCERVTGKAFEPHYWTLPKERQGPRRPVDEVNTTRAGRYVPEGRTQAVYDVLCGLSATWEVRSARSPVAATTVCCWRCVTAMADDLMKDMPEGERVVELERVW